MSDESQLLPIKFSEVLQLTQLGIPASSIKFKYVTLESEKYISIREEDHVSIIETQNSSITNLPVKVDSAIMNPNLKIIGLRTQKNLQIFNLDTKTRVKQFQTDEIVDYWKWIDSNTIAFITRTSVFHWTLDEDTKPRKIFNRADYEGQVQVINYKASADKKWLILGGISAGEGGRTINGVLQLYSVSRDKSQPTMNAHAGCFAYIKLDSRSEKSHLFCFTHKTIQGPKLSIIEVGIDKKQAFKCIVDIEYANEQDFAVSMIADNKHHFLYMITKSGFLFLFEIQNGKCLLSKRVSQSTIFATSLHHETNGIVTIDQNGRMLLFTIDEENLVEYIAQKCEDYDLSARIAARCDLPGAENVFKLQFERLMESKKFQSAAKLAVDAPRGFLRTLETMKRFQEAEPSPGQPAPVLQYFSLLLKKGKLNKIESMELVRPVLKANTAAGRKHIEDWIKDEKLEYSEELGDILRSYDLKLACSVYLRGKCPEKAIGCFLQMGQFSKIIPYSKSVNIVPDYKHLLSQLFLVNREQAKDFAFTLCTNPDGNLLDAKTVFDIFMAKEDVETTTSFLLDYLNHRGDRQEDSDLQTQLLLINLMRNPAVADAIMDSEEFKFTHYNKPQIGQRCEQVGLIQRSLENYDDLESIKRCLQLGISNNTLLPEFIIKFFGDLTPEDALECLHNLLKYNIDQNIRLVIDVAKKYSIQLTSEALISLFEEFESHLGLYYYLGSFVNETEDPKVVYKFIESAAHYGQYREVERICRENTIYEPEPVKKFLLDSNLKDPRPLIYVCDRHHYIDELTRYLYNRNMFPFIEAYVHKMNISATPKVIGTLLDLNVPDDQICSLFMSVRPPQCPIKDLVFEVEKHNRLRLLLPWLEDRQEEGLQDVDLFNALAKIYIETHQNPKEFLSTNKYYDSKIIGQFCESRDPQLSLLAYKRRPGECDREFIDVTNRHEFFKDQARFLVERQDETLWASVLDVENVHRRQLIDQVVASALIESRIPEEVSTTVKAFMAANLPNELIELLERIVLHGSSSSRAEFKGNKNLQNLLILTAIKADPKRVMDYINRLDHFDGPDIAKIAVSDQYKLFEEAFCIYKKFDKLDDAMDVLINKLEDLKRGKEFAASLNDPVVWTLLGEALLNDGEVTQSIDCFLKSGDPKHFRHVIAETESSEKWEDIIPFLLMARQTLKDKILDENLCFAYAKTNRLSDLESFLQESHHAHLEDIGLKCLRDQLYEPARLIYTYIKNYGQLAICLVHLEQFQAAVDAAQKANTIPTWKAVCYACVDAKEFQLAQICALHIIVYMDHLQDLIQHYQSDGYFDQIINVLEEGIHLERSHQCMFTELGILYAKYKENKLMEHLKQYYARINIPSLIKTCKTYQHWPEVVFLYAHYDQYDNAIEVMIEHSVSCWTDALFKEIIVHVSNTEVIYRAALFYLKEHPLRLNDLLIEVGSQKFDHTRMVNKILGENVHLSLIQKYLRHIQHENIGFINECVNELCLEEEDFEGLRKSIDKHTLFDHISLARQIENHSLLEFRRIAAYLYRKQKRFDKAIELAKRDKLWKDAMETVSDSKDAALTEELLRYFVEIEEKTCFAACLFTCYPLIRPDLVLELCWRHHLMDFAMPFMIQSFGNLVSRIDVLEKENAAKDKSQKEKESHEAKKNELQMQRSADLMGQNPTLAISNSSHWMHPNSMQNMDYSGQIEMPPMQPMPPMGGHVQYGQHPHYQGW